MATRLSEDIAALVRGERNGRRRLRVQLGLGLSFRTGNGGPNGWYRDGVFLGRSLRVICEKAMQDGAQ